MYDLDLDGAGRISAERDRQRDLIGYDAENDAAYTDGQLLAAAHCYVLAAAWPGPHPETIPVGLLGLVGGCWPFPPESWHPSTDPARNLEKAGALIAAEIDRIVAERTPRPLSAGYVPPAMGAGE